MLPSSTVAVKFTVTTHSDENSASCWYCALGPLAETDIVPALPARAVPNPRVF